MSLVFLIHVILCWFMTGVIWLVQLLVYPFFNFLGKKEFDQFHQFHMRQISWLVAPVMVLELATGAWLLFQRPGQLFFWNLVSVASLWFLTAFVNVPTHNQLQYSSQLSKRNLVVRNWPRTLIWTLRSVFLAFIIFAQQSEEML
jgi:hypothetical protein